MISNPRIGQRVQAWYGPRPRDFMPHHGRVGVVLVAGCGRRGPVLDVAPPIPLHRLRQPRNHLVRFADGTAAVIDAGHLRRPSALTSDATAPVQSSLAGRRE
jgi:hypothetical protein